MNKATTQAVFDPRAARERIERGRFRKWWKRKGGRSSGFRYETCEGEPVTDDLQLERIRSLVIPPAWKHVRISPAPARNLQAVGIDGSGRIQYLYHPKFCERQQRKKFEKIERFGDYLPEMRRITSEHLSLEGFPREKTLAVMLRLINSLYIRVGTEKSVRHYRTYGITTLQNRHLTIAAGGRLIFSFVGKHRIRHRKVLVDEELATILRDLKALGGSKKLFHYLNGDGRPRAVRPSDINAYLKSVTAPEFSAKDFRTWGGTILAASELAEIGPVEDEKAVRKNIVRAVRSVAGQLGNTPTVCRSSYIHPKVLTAYEHGITIADFTPRRQRRLRGSYGEYEPEELALKKLFEEV